MSLIFKIAPAARFPPLLSPPTAIRLGSPFKSATLETTHSIEVIASSRGLGYLYSGASL
jgi:hypothetical protein